MLLTILWEIAWSKASFNGFRYQTITRRVRVAVICLKINLLITLYGLNPMVGVAEGFRWALLGTNTAPGPIIAVSAAAALVILVTGAFYFRRMEKTFADLV